VNKIRILIADDNSSFRESITQELIDYPEIEVVSNYSDGLEIISLLEKNSPDIIFIDVNLPIISGLSIIHLIKKRFPSIYTVVLSLNYGKINDYIQTKYNPDKIITKNELLKHIDEILDEFHLKRNENLNPKARSKKSKKKAI